VQTFLPYPDFTRPAKCLDRQRLGKQRVEVLQLLKALLVPGSGWTNHPAAKMWRGFESALVTYGEKTCLEWMSRGYRDTCARKIQEIWFMYLADQGGSSPPWLGDPAFHASHRSNLLRKDPVHYGQFGWSEPSDLPYVWPTPHIFQEQ
jgi:hypothetical protein